MDRNQREAVMLRGRCGTDVWQRYVEKDQGGRRDFLHRFGVPQERSAEVDHHMVALLSHEDIRA